MDLTARRKLGAWLATAAIAGAALPLAGCGSGGSDTGCARTSGASACTSTTTPASTTTHP